MRTVNSKEIVSYLDNLIETNERLAEEFAEKGDTGVSKFFFDDIVFMKGMKSWVVEAAELME